MHNCFLPNSSFVHNEIHIVFTFITGYMYIQKMIEWDHLVLHGCVLQQQATGKEKHLTVSHLLNPLS